MLRPNFCGLLASLTLILACATLSRAQDDFEDYNVELVANVDYTEGNDERGNDVWGYVGADGTEYAIAGSTAATYIYSLADPSAPELVARVEGAPSIWRDMKSYGEYVYVVTDQGQDGLLVIDMSEAPDSVSAAFYKPRIAGFPTNANQVLTNHNLYISREGVLVLSGGNVGAGRPLLFDLNASPTAPPYLGAARAVYAHDVWAEGGVLLSSDIYAGELTVHDYTAEGEVSALGSVTTPNRFTHNAWPNDERSVAFTTDERSGSFVGGYDIADPGGIRELDRFRPDATYTSGSIPHNTHVTADDYLVTSWYRDGVILTDASRPGNLVEVGRYDTYEGGGTGFQGAWGAYPFLPSGLILVSDIQRGLFVLRPDYQRGCYLEGQVVDGRTGNPIPDAAIDFAGLRAQSTRADLGGNFATGIFAEGTYRVVVNHPGYLPRGFDASLARGQVDQRVVRLERLADAQVSVRVEDLAGDTIPGAEFALVYRGQEGPPESPTTLRYDLVAGAWGYRTSVVEDLEVVVGQPTELTIALPTGIYDDFAFDAGWTVSTTANSGGWERALPIGTRADGLQVQADRDVGFDFGGFAYVTGAGFGDVGVDDVDNGTTRLTSPPFDGSALGDSRLEFFYSFYVGGGDSPPDDTLFVELSNGSEIVRLPVATAPTLGYEAYRSPPLSELLTVGDAMTVAILTGDEGAPHLVEAAIDALTVTAAERPQLMLSETSGCAPFSLDATAGDRTLGPDTRWLFEGAEEPGLTGATATPSYPEAGTYDVTLTVVGDDGGRAAFVYPDAVEVFVEPSAEFFVQQAGDTVFFFNESPGGRSALWSFGDGATSTDLFAAHSYDAPGVYPVTLTVTNRCGSDTLTQSVTVAAASDVDALPPETGLRVLVNPVRGNLLLEVPTSPNPELREAILYSANGVRVASYELGAGPRHELRLGNLGNGLYFVAVGRSVARFVVAR